jgi:hypothetical protein
MNHCLVLSMFLSYLFDVSGRPIEINIECNYLESDGILNLYFDFYFTYKCR